MRNGALLAFAMTSVALGLLSACGPSPKAEPPSRPGHSSLAALPDSYAECRATRGELEPEDRGGRCFSYYTPQRDRRAYTACRDAGGIPRAVGPGRSVAGNSHVCTLSFSPEPLPETDANP